MKDRVHKSSLIPHFKVASEDGRDDSTQAKLFEPLTEASYHAATVQAGVPLTLRWGADNFGHIPYLRL